MIQVADSTDGASLQPRVRVRDRIAEILDEAPRSEASGYPAEFTHRTLARLVYATDEPTLAQESAVRRAVAALVKAGRAERLTEDRMARTQGRGYHHRISAKGNPYAASNPAGVGVRRPLTADDREARASVAERAGYAEYAAKIRAGERT